VYERNSAVFIATLAMFNFEPLQDGERIQSAQVVYMDREANKSENIGGTKLVPAFRMSGRLVEHTVVRSIDSGELQLCDSY
jgi:hypothetical protein